MNTEVICLLLLGLAFLALFGLSEWLYHKRQWDVEHTRKVSHAGAGLLALSFPLMFSRFWEVALLCALFLIILAITKHTGLLRSIHAITRESYGSTMFPLVVAICFWRFTQSGNMVHFYLPVLVMALADPAACLAGKRMPLKRMYLNKSLGGALAFFLVAFSIALIVFMAIGHEPFSAPLVFRASAMALVTAFAEAVSAKGFDNLTIPVAALLVI